MKTTLSISIKSSIFTSIQQFFAKHLFSILTISLIVTSIVSTYYFSANGLTLAYNDARSHLDIARRVVEGLKPGIAQLGSVWLPLPHLLMVPTVWNDFMWHSGLAGALPSMISFIATGLIIYKFLEELKVSILGRLFGVLLFVANLNILYLQSTAMTELLLLATMTFASYDLLRWYTRDSLIYLIRSAFWVMLATLVRYDGWFLFLWMIVLVVYRGFSQKGAQKAEGLFIFFCSLAGLGVVLWLLWNGLIFHDPLYFAFGPFSAHAQQAQLDAAGVLQTKNNIGLSLLMYWYAMSYNSILFTVFIGLSGIFVLWFSKEKHLSFSTKLVTTALIAPLVFNILALYWGHSVLFIQGVSGNTWFNVRYGIMMLPSFAVFGGYLIHKLRSARVVILLLFLFVTFFQFVSFDAVTIDDGRVGSSQKNVSDVSNWLRDNAKNTPGFILISAASHDAIIFSSTLPMKKFIHEGTGKYWESATSTPDRWARWIVMRTNDENDLSFKLVNKSKQLDKYVLVQHFPFADIYELKSEYLPELITEPILGRQK